MSFTRHKPRKSSSGLNATPQSSSCNDTSVSSILKQFKKPSAEFIGDVALLFETKDRLRNNETDTPSTSSITRLEQGLAKAKTLNVSATEAVPKTTEPTITESDTQDFNPPPNLKVKKYFTDEQKKEVSRRTIFIGNVPVAYTTTSLRRFLKIAKSQIESIRFRSVPVDPKFQHQRHWASRQHMLNNECDVKNAYIVFVKEEDSQTFLASNKSLRTPEGKTLRITTTSFHRKTFSLFGYKSTVFVGNLYVKTTEDDLREAFEKNVGPVNNVRIIRDPVLYISKCFGFVQLGNCQDVSKAIKVMHGFILHKRPLNVTKALPESQAHKVDESRKNMIQRKIKAKSKKKGLKKKSRHVRNI